MLLRFMSDPTMGSMSNGITHLYSCCFPLCVPWPSSKGPILNYVPDISEPHVQESPCLVEGGPVPPETSSKATEEEDGEHAGVTGAQGRLLGEHRNTNSRGRAKVMLLLT